ncbi:hypothetical protein F511_36646 [Dorcoceras hygrometricum]|uniref:Uncharacterized protein n=1 Tax=Dorcoceras hygrometricum TaxID=472368 RepID=A0A2Z7BBR3_9LAMI|nr:hypothetical protein F511_36646 [Dorcoceras hygrometricum]
MQYLNRAKHEKGNQESSVDKSTTTQLCRSHQSSLSCDLQVRRLSLPSQGSVVFGHDDSAGHQIKIALDLSGATTQPADHNLLTSVHFATTSFSNTVACDWFCLRLVTFACDWSLLLATGYRFLRLVTVACDWLLLLATGFACGWFFLRLVSLVIARFLASEFHQRLVPVSLATSLYQRLLLSVACFNTFESFSLKLALNLE